MSRILSGAFIAFLCTGLAATSFAKPPAHAPAHGQRAKEEPKEQRVEVQPDTRTTSGFEIAYDSERGISVAVGFPGVYVHGGQFYREQDGQWQISARADGGWKAIEASVAPDPVRKAHGRSGPAKARHKP